MRTVISEKDVQRWAKTRGVADDAPPAEPAPDKYKDRLLKYIPAEVIALYITLNGILRSATNDPTFPEQLVAWIIFGVGLFGTWLYLWRVSKVSKTWQYVISIGAFAVWVFALGGPFVYLAWYRPVYGALFLPTYTFLVATYEG